MTKVRWFIRRIFSVLAALSGFAWIGIGFWLEFTGPFSGWPMVFFLIIATPVVVYLFGCTLSWTNPFKSFSIAD